MQYEREMMAFSDHAHALEFAEKKGFGKGEKLGIGKGILKVAKNMLTKGYSIADIIGVTALSREQIKALR